MKRRSFLHYSALSSTTLLLPGFLKGFSETPFQSLNSAKRLIIVQLSGGNDGLNTLIPFRNDIYYSSRPKLAIPSEQVLKISDEMGFNPSLSGFRRLYDEGYMAIYNGVGYPNPDRSHFRSMDIWHSGSGAEENWNTGWIGRWLDSACKLCESHTALEIDDTLSLAMKGVSQSGFAVKNPKQLFNSLNSEGLKVLRTQNMEAQINESELGYLYKTFISTQASASAIYEHASKWKSSKTYPMHESGEHFKLIAELINSGLESRLYYTSLSGFDTHIRQNEAQGRILGHLGNGLSTMCEDLIEADNFKDTVILVFSEFGRRVKQNASNGTDHGTANNIYIIGGNLKSKGILNEVPDLTKLDNGDLIHTLDFRRIYASLLDNVLHVPHKEILKKSFEPMGFI